MVVNEAEIAEATDRVRDIVFQFLRDREGHAPASEVLKMLAYDQDLPEYVARSAIWLMLEQGNLLLGKDLELKPAE